MEPGQEANSDNLVKYFRFSTHNKNISLNICFLELAEEFRRDSKMSSN